MLYCAVLCCVVLCCIHLGFLGVVKRDVIHGVRELVYEDVVMVIVGVMRRAQYIVDQNDGPVAGHTCKILVLASIKGARVTAGSIAASCHRQWASLQMNKMEEKQEVHVLMRVTGRVDCF